MHSPLKCAKKSTKFICSECDKEYTENKNLLRHLRKAHNKILEKPALSYDFKCPACEKAFTRRNNLLRHVRLTHNRNDIQFENCPECSKNSCTDQTQCTHQTEQPDLNFFEVDVDEILPLEDYPNLKNMLPTGYTYKIKEYTPLHKENTLKTVKEWFGAKVQFYCNTVNEAKKWKELFEELNKLSFRVRSVHHPKGEKVHSRFRCHHNTHPKQNSRPREKHTACPAQLTLTILEIRKNVLKTNCRIIHKHNHLLSSPSELKFRRPSKSIIDKFKMLFSVKKLTVPQALKIHRADLEAEYGDNFRNLLLDRAYMPDKRWAYSLYYKCLDQNKISDNDLNYDIPSDYCESSENNPKLISVQRISNPAKLTEEIPPMDLIDSFRSVCDEMVQVFRKDVVHFESGIKAFVSAYRSMPDVKSDLLTALHNFADYKNNVEIINSTL